MKELDWSHIYKNESGRLLGILRRYVSEIETAEDILHESFIKAMQSAHSFKNKGAFDAWLRQITINTALDYIRKNKELSFTNTEEVQIAEEQEPLQQHSQSAKDIILNASFSRDELLEIIDQLSANHKTVFNLYVIDGATHKEIAQKLDISETLSKTTLSRARKKVHELLHTQALEKQNESKKRKGILFGLSTAIAGESFADTIFKTAFKNNFTTPTNTSNNIESGLQQAQPIVVKTTLQAVKTIGTIAVGTGVAASITVGIVSYNSQNEEPKIKTQKNIVETKPTNKEIKDTLKIESLAFGTKAEENQHITKQKAETTGAQKEEKNNETMPITAKTDSANNNLALNNADSIQTENKPIKKKVIIKKKVYLQQ